MSGDAEAVQLSEIPCSVGFAHGQTCAIIRAVVSQEPPPPSSPLLLQPSIFPLPSDSYEPESIYVDISRQARHCISGRCSINSSACDLVMLFHRSNMQLLALRHRLPEKVPKSAEPSFL